MVSRDTTTNKFGYRCLILVAMIAAGCSSLQRPNSLVARYSWGEICYDSFRKDVDYLAGATTQDCGFLHADSDSEKQIAACAKSVVASGKPFKFGYLSYGYDSGYCDVAIKSSDGQLWSLYYDSDSSGGAGRTNNYSTLAVSRCNRIEFVPGTIGRGSFFSLKGCSAAREVAKSIAAQREPKP